MVTDERAAEWERAAVEVLASCEDLNDTAPRLAHAILALVRDRGGWQRYAERFTGTPKEQKG